MPFPINWENIFTYNTEKPLLFTQLFFWGFYAVVLFLYSFFYKKNTLRSTYLFLISLFFYYKTSGLYFMLLVFSTVSDYFIGNAIYNSAKLRNKKWLLALSIFINLLLLSYFKYSYLFVDGINYVFGLDLQVVNYFAMFANSFGNGVYDIDKIILPVGISFYTFQTISYVVDIYREKVKPVNNILDFGFYVSFFPQLVAGPIVRASSFIPQIYKPYSLSNKDFGRGLYLILCGLIKKMIFGDYLAVNFIDRVFATPSLFSGFESVMALFGYTLQVYCDFSGYTDIAIGVALLLGFRLPVNFNSPYKALNVGDFWKRWHISLSSWLKDYLYIPIGGNRKGKARTNINLMITMLLGGLWHGADWKFIIWGGLNGIGLLIYKQWKKVSLYEGSNNLLIRAWRIFFTLCFITFTRIWFRGESMENANQVLFSLFSWPEISVIFDIIKVNAKVFGVLLLGFIIHWLPSIWKDYMLNLFIRLPLYIKILICVWLVFIIYQTRVADLQPFIYFQF